MIYYLQMFFFFVFLQMFPLYAVTSTMFFSFYFICLGDVKYYSELIKSFPWCVRPVCVCRPLRLDSAVQLLFTRLCRLLGESRAAERC